METNMLMSVATGRDAEAGDLLRNPPPGIQFAVPQVCFMEALSALDDEKRRRNQLSNILEQQAVQLQRDKTSAHARSLQLLLEAARIKNEMLISEIDTRLFEAFDQIARMGDLIALSQTSLLASRADVWIPDLTDNLILHCILEHARAQPAETKVLLSGNHKDFGTNAVRDALQDAGIHKYVVDARQFLGWYRSQPDS